MVKKKEKKSTQSKKKLDLAAAVEAAEQEEEETDLSNLNLNDGNDSLAASAGKSENGKSIVTETGKRNDGEEETVLMNYNPPEEGPSTADKGKLISVPNNWLHAISKSNCFNRVRDNPQVLN